MSNHECRITKEWRMLKMTNPSPRRPEFAPPASTFGIHASRVCTPGIYGRLTGFARVGLIRRACLAQPLADAFQALGQLALEPAIDRPIILSIDAQVILRGDAVGCFVGILIAR